MAEMTEVAKGVATHQRLVALLTQENARYRVVNHEAVGKCEAVSEIRGTALGQGAKALVCKVKGNGVNQHVLAILAADQQADLSQLASHLGGLRASLASPAEVDMLTGCVFGAIPPFSFHPNLKLVADPLLFERFDEIAFNAGLLEKSVIMNTQDYLRIARPELAVFCRFQSSPTAQSPPPSRSNTDTTIMIKMAKNDAVIISASRNGGSYIIVSSGRQQ